MNMYKPPHPGEFIQVTYMEPFNLSCRYLAAQLDVSPSTLNRILKQQSGISPELADVPAKQIHNPPAECREQCGYPQPVVDYKQARVDAIAAFKGLPDK